MKGIIKNTLILTLITLIAGVGLGYVYEITKEPIAQSEEAAKREAWQQVFPEAGIDDFVLVDVDSEAAETAIAEMGVNAEVNEVVEVKAGELGYVITTTDKDGYGGDITITVGITSEGTVSGISILSISETAGLGMRATQPEFYEQYGGKEASKLAVNKDGGEIDALSGATIPSRAVTGAVNTAIGYYQAKYQ
jgi:electron transport complex protein RnfG